MRWTHLFDDRTMSETANGGDFSRLRYLLALLLQPRPILKFCRYGPNVPNGMEIISPLARAVPGDHIVKDYVRQENLKYQDGDP